MDITMLDMLILPMECLSKKVWFHLHELSVLLWSYLLARLLGTEYRMPLAATNR